MGSGLLTGGSHGQGEPFEPVLERGADGTVTLVRHGLVVEPVRGRLVVFSAGGENYHTPLAVGRGARRTFHAWFSCSTLSHDNANIARNAGRD